MKLFLRNHLSFIILYIIMFITLPIVIHRLDGFENHYGYFMFLSIISLVILLFVRYVRRKKFYMHIGKKSIDIDEFLIHQPNSPIEKAYADQLRFIHSFLISKDESNKDFLQEQQLMISYAVHQMKTPLSVIQLLIQSNQSKELSLFLEWQKVKVESNKLDFALNQLLTYSRSTKILSDLKIEPFVLKEIVQEVINDLKDYFIEKEVYPKITLDENISIYSDRKWLKVVVYQLLSNAIKYGDSESVVYVYYKKGQLFIRNKGDTIPESEVNRVFNLFYTGSKGRTKGEATGIGLYLVEKILHALNYSFDLHSANNETIFTINLLGDTETTIK